MMKNQFLNKKSTKGQSTSKEFQALYYLVSRLQKETSVEFFGENGTGFQSLEDNAMKENLKIAMDYPGGGNCMFYALSHQLESVGIERSHEELQQDIVQYLRSNNVLQGRDGQIDFRSFIHGYSSWEEYLQSMSNDEEWGGG